MAAGLRVGLNAKFYYNAGTYGTPTWTVIPIVGDLNLNLDKGEAIASDRASTWEMILPTLKKAPLDWTMSSDTSDATHDVLRDDYINDTLVDLAIADDVIATSGTRYFRADYYLTGFAIKQPLTEKISVDCKANLARSAHVPAFTTAS